MIINQFCVHTVGQKTKCGGGGLGYIDLDELTKAGNNFPYADFFNKAAKKVVSFKATVVEAAIGNMNKLLKKNVTDLNEVLATKNGIFKKPGDENFIGNEAIKANSAEIVVAVKNAAEVTKKTNLLQILKVKQPFKMSIGVKSQLPLKLWNHWLVHSIFVITNLFTKSKEICQPLIMPQERNIRLIQKKTQLHSKNSGILLKRILP